ncbi:MAG: HAMP domain-containing histidine kinase [Clostridiales bacterium]|nr:HAMP domain-containing histidine kinase [Clostridiales bacterium]
MKFGQKIFIYALVFNIVALNVVAYLIISNNHGINVERESSRRIDEHNMLMNLIYSEIVVDKINNQAVVLGERNIINAMTIISNDYIINNFNERPDVSLGLYSGDRLIYGTLKYDVKESMGIIGVQGDGLSIITEDIDGKAVLAVASNIRLNAIPYTMISTYDINPIFEIRNQQIDFFKKINLIISCSMAIILWLLIYVLMLRMKRMTKAVRQVSLGDYSIHMNIGGNDEISGLSKDFNKMILAINKNISELEDLAEARKKFIDNLTHEIKTPLTSIIGFADLLRSARTVDDSTRVDYVNSIYDEGKHFEKLSDRLMEMILLERTQLNREEVEMNEFIDDISSQMAPLLEKRNINIKSKSTTEYCILRVDKDLIKSLIMNLIDNASKSYVDGGTLEITLKDYNNGKTALSVKDYGCGMPEDELNKVMEPFYMLDKSRTRKSGGAGLGLALCKEIAVVHNAQLIIKSKLGQGTCVTVLLVVLTRL